MARCKVDREAGEKRWVYLGPAEINERSSCDHKVGGPLAAKAPYVVAL